MTLSALVSYGMIRKWAFKVYVVNLYYWLKYIKKECTFEDLIYKNAIYPFLVKKRQHISLKIPSRYILRGLENTTLNNNVFTEEY